MMNRKNGFTLVELAIALMVIGLLIGGVLKGQELIENARITRTVKDINDFDTAVMILKNTYNALPGDMKNAARRLPNCGEPYCNLTSTSNGNYKIAPESERRNFWIHLERAGLISGINEQEDFYLVSPKNAFGGNYVVWHTSYLGDGTMTPEGNLYRLGDLETGGAASDTLKNCSLIQRIDVKMDDGKPSQGRVKTRTSACIDTDTEEYTQSNTRSYIHIWSNSMN